MYANKKAEINPTNLFFMLTITESRVSIISTKYF